MQDRDKLAIMAGGRVEHLPGWRTSHFYHFAKESYPSLRWQPQTSFDDCRPLLEEIERRGLHEAFLDQLMILVRHGNQLCDNPSYAGMWRMLYYCKPVNIVEAFIKTMEANCD